MSFSFDFTPEKLAHCAKRNKDIPGLFAALEEVLPRYEITTVERVAAFLAQCGHESVDFTVLQENLNYSAKGLSLTWPKRFPSEADAHPYHRNPEKIANRVYSSRMGNGDEASGDGWKYRGRGAIQLTGRDNYTAFAKSINKSLEDTVTYLETLPGAIESAAWFWKRNNLNALADARDIVTSTRRINGGTIGLEDRRRHFEHNLTVLKG
jgi:putative chitinase